ncbi:hypothetical protein Tco_1416609 [Tanacetum coccineum]
MSTLKFADTHNMVAFLSKPAESEGFEQFVDFLNANPINYDLTVNPAIYTSCIEQFWDTIKAKTINGEVQLQGLVDGKKVIIIESTLTLIGYKTTAWNKFSSTMASAIICFARNQKFNFSKYIFESMVKNLDNVNKFLMYPRKGFFRRETPLFQTMVVQDQVDVGEGEGSAIPTDPHHTPTIIQPSTSQPQRKQRPRKPKRKDTKIPQSSGPTDNVADEAVYKKMDDSLERAATTATSLDAEQDRGNINKTQSKATPNEPSSPGTSLGGGPRRQESMRDIIAQTRFENVTKTSNDPLLARGNTLQSGEDSLKLQELMELCTTLQLRVLDLETTKTTQATEIASMKRVGSSRRLESFEDKGLGKEDASKQGRIADIDGAKDIYQVNVHRDEDMFGVNDLDGDEVVVEIEVGDEVVVETKVAQEVVVETEVSSITPCVFESLMTSINLQ